MKKNPNYAKMLSSALRNSHTIEGTPTQDSSLNKQKHRKAMLRMRLFLQEISSNILWKKYLIDFKKSFIDSERHNKNK